jgi:hypothetical protein
MLSSQAIKHFPSLVNYVARVLNGSKYYLKIYVDNVSKTRVIEIKKKGSSHVYHEIKWWVGFNQRVFIPIEFFEEAQTIRMQKSRDINLALH